jgi:hypothetical protein
MEVVVMEVVERISSWKRRTPQRIAVIVAVTVKRGGRAWEEEEGVDEHGQLVLDRKMLIDQGGRSRVLGLQLKRQSDNDDDTMHLCSRYVNGSNRDA